MNLAVDWERETRTVNLPGSVAITSYVQVAVAVKADVDVYADVFVNAEDLDLRDQNLNG